MKIYLAGPLFTLPELDFNTRLRDLLEQAGHEVWLPQEQTRHLEDAASILRKLLEGLRACDVVVANMDGSDPDSGTCWECGYAYGCDKPTILFRTDARSERNVDLGPYNLMMWASATVHLDGPFPSVTALASAIIPFLDQTTLTRQMSERRAGLQITG